MLLPLRYSQLESAAGAADAGLGEVGRISVPRMIGMNLSSQGPLWSQWGIATQIFNSAMLAIQNGEAVGPALDAAQREVDS
jgi:hypothetical protein